MQKRKKKMRNPVKTDSKKNDLPAQIKKITDGLYYMSETDAEILPFTGKKVCAVTSQEILKQSGSDLNAAIEEKDFAQFFTRLTEKQDWFGDEETATAAKFRELKDLLEKSLRDLKCFKIGKIQLDIYIVGIDAENNLTGIKTKAVET
ncbi:MAG: nuclease A inhibitor family protein [Acidobacteriota bacterium]|nr:nuclease A inhibitor family protein [Acidobacteriota bacterium]